VVQKLLGHASPHMTSHYAKVHDATIREAFDRYQAQRVNITGQQISYDPDTPTALHNAQPPTRSASGSMPPALRSPACEPGTTLCANSSPASSASSGPSTISTRQPSRNDPVTTTHTAAAATCLRRKTAIYQALSADDFR
jgi:hypothetical protein